MTPIAPVDTESLHSNAEAASARLLSHYRSVRRQSLELCDPLTPEDMMVQSCIEASPAKWHIAHTTWFFETFVLREFASGYRPLHPDFLWLFNSYYNSVSDQPEKKLRASFSRPSLASILAYREHVDRGVEALLHAGAADEAERRIVLGLHHEQQHQELLVTDIRHAFWSNPLRPAYRKGVLTSEDVNVAREITAQRWCSFEGGLAEIGHRGDDFCFDNEQPRHRTYLQPFELATRPVSCAEYLQFMQDGGYVRADLWLSEGWQTAQQEQWQAPLYWHQEGDAAEWSIFTLRGDQLLNTLLAAPVCNVSYFEADAFARWAGCKLPTEAEWEIAAAAHRSDAREHCGAAAKADLLESETLHPLACFPTQAGCLQQMIGGVWEWTASAYLGYPGYNALPGALGEYNGKFMCNQMVLRGGSVATPASHIRETYRNFFSPATRWQFSGIRLARR